MLGETPLALHDLFPGEYRVQVECEPGRRGRVHTADVTTGSTSVFVDLRFDLAVSTQPVLHLRYGSAEEELEQRVADVEQISKAVPARAFVLVSKPSPEVLELELVSGTPLGQRGLARIKTGPQGPTRGDIALASRALLEGKCTDFTPSDPVPLLCEGEAVPAEPAAVPTGGWPAHRPPKGQFITGLTLASLGTVSLITGYALFLPRKSTAEDWLNDIDPNPDSVRVDATHDSVRVDATQEKWLNLNTGIIIAGAVGGAALVAAMPLVLPKRDKTPWLAWLSGGLGLGLTAFSIAWGVTADDKPPTSCSSPSIDPIEARTCITRSEQVSLAILTGATAAPLLTIPLVYLLRPSEKNIQPSVEVGRNRAYVGVSGEF
jgi:hypothetical protein